MSHDIVLLGVQETSATHSGLDDPGDLIGLVEDFLPSSDPGAIDDVVAGDVGGSLAFETFVVDEASGLLAVRFFNQIPVLVDVLFSEDVV